MNDAAPSQPPQSPAELDRKTRLVHIVDRQGNDITDVRIPHFITPPGMIVLAGRTFQLSSYGVSSSATEAPADAVLIYRETFSYVVPEPGEAPTSLSSELEELTKLRAFHKEVLDPMLQPTRHGTVLAAIVDKLGGANFSTMAGRIHREQSSRGS